LDLCALRIADERCTRNEHSSAEPAHLLLPRADGSSEFAVWRSQHMAAGMGRALSADSSYVARALEQTAKRSTAGRFEARLFGNDPRWRQP